MKDGGKGGGRGSSTQSDVADVERETDKEAKTETWPSDNREGGASFGSVPLSLLLYFGSYK